jgi:hypothetical protein
MTLTFSKGGKASRRSIEGVDAQASAVKGTSKSLPTLKGAP